MQEDRFRVSVCLKRFYCDERSRAYVSVVPRHQVRWLHERLRCLFSLRGQFCLCTRGHLLPSEEPLSLLQPDDPVEVIPLSTDSSEKRVINLKSNGLLCLPPHEENVGSNVLTPQISDSMDSTSFEHEKNIGLLEVKQKALQLLDRFSEESVVVEDVIDAVDAQASAKEGTRRRRRVRRRKRRPSTDEVCCKSEAPVSVRDTDAGLTDEVFGEKQGICVGPRKARLVHSLSHNNLQPENNHL